MSSDYFGHVTSKLFAYKSIYLSHSLNYLSIYRIWHWIAHEGWYAIKHNYTKLMAVENRSGSWDKTWTERRIIDWFLKLDTTGREIRFTENCARNWNLTKVPNGTSTNQNPSCRMKRIKFSGILKYKQII